MHEGIFVVCEAALGAPQTASLELIGKARALSGTAGVTAVAYGQWQERSLHALIAAGADIVRHLQMQADMCEDDTAVGDALTRLIAQQRPAVVLMSATIRGRCIAPWIAAKLGTGLTADCTDLSLEADGSLLQTRPAFGGSLTADILCRTRPQMATVRPKTFPVPVPDRERRGHIVRTPCPQAEVRLRRESFAPMPMQSALGSVDVVLAGGKGIGSREGFDRLRGWAAQVGAAVGATRSAVDAGYAHYDCQIGQTGVTVKPRLYVAVAISGAVQHIAGMAASETVLAINRDPRAPIFQYADYGVVGDWRNILPRVIERFMQLEGSQ